MTEARSSAAQMPSALKRRHTVAGIVACGIIFGYALLSSRDPLSQRLSRTYSELMRGPLVLDQEDPILIDTIRRSFDGPSSEPYNLRDPEQKDNSQSGQQAYLLELIGKKRGGTFLEAGAFNGETHSNTLYMERFLDWTGVLVEAEDSNYAALLQRHRRCRSLNACLSPTSYPQQFAFENSPGTVVSYVYPEFTEKDLDDKMRLKQCYPLYSVLAAAGLTSLDFLSLDVEGIDLQVLESLPWKNVDIKIVMVEYVTPGFQFPNGEFRPEFEKPIKEIMFANDYLVAHRLPTDLIFVKNGSEFDTRI